MKKSFQSIDGGRCPAYYLNMDTTTTSRPSRSSTLNAYTVRQLRIYGRKQGVLILQKWTKPQLVAALVRAGK